MRNILVSAVAAAAVVVVAGVGQAQVIMPNTLGAIVNLPFLTSGTSRVTVATVTNTDQFTPYRLHVEWISGSTWGGIDFNCPLTPAETTYFVFEKNAAGGSAKVTFECSDATATGPDPSRTNNIFTRSVPGEDGIMMVVLEAANGAPGQNTPVPNNVLVGDATVLDFAQGTAFSVPGVHVQGIAPVPGRTYLYDAAQYNQYPDSLTTNYIAPDDNITAELILYTPDGTVGGGPGVNARLTGFLFDDDENDTSGSISFDCFTVKPINALDAFGENATRTFGGHLVGHLQLFPDIALRNDLHDLDPVVGDGNGARIPPVHGWILQTIASGGDLADAAIAAGTMAANGAWGRQLGQSAVALVPLGGDTAGTVAD